MKKLLFVLTFSAIAFGAFSQQNVVSSGQNNQNSSGKVTYSVGLINYKPSEGTGGSSSTGTQIPFEVLTVLSLDKENLISVNLFPNPTSDFISINLTKEEPLNFKIFDIAGKEISEGSINRIQTKINIKSLKTSIYLLNIYKDGLVYESYKIIKK